MRKINQKMEASWGLLGPLEGVLVSWGRLESFVGRLGGVLGRLGGVLGSSWWATWLQLGPQNRAKIDKKSMQKTIKILMPLRIGFFMNFCRFWMANGRMLASQIEDFSNFWPSKRPSKFHRFLHRFFIDFSSVLASNMGPSWEPRRLKIRKNGF